MKAISVITATVIFLSACGEQETAPTGSDNHTGGGAAAPQSESTVDSLGSQLTPGSVSAETDSAGNSNPSKSGSDAKTDADDK